MCYPSKNAMKKLPGLSHQNDDVNKEKWLGEIHIDPERKSLLVATNLPTSDFWDFW